MIRCIIKARYHLRFFPKNSLTPLRIESDLSPDINVINDVLFLVGLHGHSSIQIAHNLT